MIHFHFEQICHLNGKSSKFSRWRQHPVDDDEKLVFFKVQTPQKAALPSMRFSLL